MVKPLLYDFRRTMTSKSVLITMGIIILLALAIIPIVNAAGAPTSVVGNTSAVPLVYFDSAGYHVLVYSYNKYGQPLSGTVFSMSVNDSSGSHTGSATTNNTGVGTLLVPTHETSGPVSAAVTILYGSQSVAATRGFPQPPAVGTVFSFGDQINPVVDSSNASKIDLLVVDEGTNGTIPSNNAVYYSFAGERGAGKPVIVGGALNESSMTRLGKLDSLYKVFSLPTIPRATASIMVAIFAPDGSSTTASGFSASEFRPFAARLQADTILTTFSAAIFSILVPLMAILVAYGSYGKDRVSGVLESVISKPVTRRGLGVSRYFSVILALATSIGLTFIVIDVISLVLIGTGLSLQFAAISLGALIVEAASFVGIVMLISHLLKSSGALIGVGVVLWVLLDFLWGLLVLVASTALGYGVGSANYLAVSIDSNFFNPAQFYLLIGEYLNGASINTTGFGGTAISPATYGLTPVTLALTGVFWVAAPLTIFLYLAMRRD